MTSENPSGTATREPEPPPAFDQNRSESLALRIQHVLHARPILGPLAVLVLAIIAFSLLSGRFLSAANLGLVLQQVTVGQTLVILTAGIDLSTGAIAVFSSIIMANLTTKAGLPGGAALIVGLLCGLAMGAFNGWLVTPSRGFTLGHTKSEGEPHSSG